MEKTRKGLLISINSIHIVLGNILLFLVLMYSIIREELFRVSKLSGINLSLIRFIIMIFSIIAFVILVAQYLVEKIETLYVATLFYFNFTVEVILRFLLSIENRGFPVDYEFYFTTMFRQIFFLIVLIYIYKYKKDFSKRRWAISFFYVLIGVIMIGIDFLCYKMNIAPIDIFYSLALVIDILNVIFILIILCKSKDILYFFISISLMLSIMSGVYEIQFLEVGTGNFITSYSLVQFRISVCSFIVLLIGAILKGYEILRIDSQTGKESEEKISFIEDNIKELILILNEDLKIDYASASLKKVLGYESEEILGKDISKILVKEKKEQYKHQILNYDKKNLVKLFELLDKKNKIVKGEVWINNFKDSKGNRIGLAMFINPLYEEDELNKLKGELKEIKELEETQKEFFSDLSHELRTPVNIMYSSIQLLEMKKSEKNNDEFLKYYNKYGKVMKQNALIMLKLINNLIDTNKLDSGFIKCNFNNYNIVSIIENITMISIPYLEEKGINLIFDTEIEEHFIKCDPDKIERIMLNLLSNAAKYTEKGGTINVDLLFNESFVKVIVKDSGVGIPDNMKEKIFKKFEQVQNRKEKKLGSGIGLALVKSLVEVHGGTIDVESKLGKGSTFIVNLPNKVDTEKDEYEILNYDSQSKNNLSIEFSDL